MNEEEKQRIKKIIETEFSIQSLDDMANMFYKIARALKHPLTKISLELTKSWGEQFEENKKENNTTYTCGCECSCNNVVIEQLGTCDHCHNEHR